MQDTDLLETLGEFDGVTVTISELGSEYVLDAGDRRIATARPYRHDQELDTIAWGISIEVDAARGADVFDKYDARAHLHDIGLMYLAIKKGEL